MKANSLAHYAGMGLFAIGATFLQASMVNAAHADEAPGKQAVRVSDLDLSRSGDVAKLYSRIRAAAEAVCGNAEITGSILPAPEHTRCVTKTVADSVAKINNATLSAYHLQETADAKEARKRGA